MYFAEEIFKNDIINDIVLKTVMDFILNKSI